MSWSLTPDEFAHVWRRADLDRIPYPLRVLESPRTESDARLLRAELAQRFPADPDLDACLRILALPHTRVIAIGGSPEPGREVRALGCVVHDRGVLAVQAPGRTREFGGPVQLSIGHSGKLGARLAALLPKAPAGRYPARSASAAAVRDTETVIQEERAAPLIRKLLYAPHTADGHIRIEAHLDRPNPPPPLHYTWLDVENDGRYLLKADENVHLVPASPEQLAAHLQKRIPG
ncbi:ESX secretion-associated protein EspG [Nocardia sp. NBC_01329]|uniref:ESX secretion-associated protein EspG n=1 Tax=Nocardia sp. NBC_01329 TaxID=2903594 RepID=UPI002E0FB610|nr:ESX secretion-associated protein EspG [Nocardia sp. NBC_01329]